MAAKKKPTLPAASEPDWGGVERALKMMERHGLEEFEYSDGAFHVRLKKPAAGGPVAAAAPAAVPVAADVTPAAAAPAAPAAAQPAPPAAEAEAAEKVHIVKSPIVGTYYGAPSPGAPAFVRVGDHVNTGHVLCIIEAMKLMNEIESDVAGEIVAHLRRKRPAGGIRRAALRDPAERPGATGLQRHVPKNPYRQPRRNRPADHPRLKELGHPDRRGLFGGGPELAARAVCRRGGLHRAAALSSDSYLNIPAVISAAEITNADAIHPGYGFLSENANFAEVCEASHITFIGPSPDMIRLMGEKDRARQKMAEVGVPIIPGSDGVVGR